MHVVGMKEASNDNEEFPFVSIGLASALILNKLRLATQLGSASDNVVGSDSGSNERAGEAKQDRGADSEYVRQRLRELAAFEKRASGK